MEEAGVSGVVVLHVSVHTIQSTVQNILYESTIRPALQEQDSKQTGTEAMEAPQAQSLPCLEGPEGWIERMKRSSIRGT